MPTYKVSIVVDAKDKASRPLQSVGSALQRVAEVAGGMLLARGLQNIAEGIGGLVSRAVDAASAMQNLSLALETLAAREIVQSGAAQSLGEAMEKARPKAQALLAELRKIAIVSPFEYEQVANTFRLTMAFGAASDQAASLTRAILDTGAALGFSADMLDRTTYNLAQALVQGDLTSANLRQLKMVGIDLAGVFRDQLGMSVKEVSEALATGKLTMQDVSDAFVRYADENFGGAAERMSKTFQGLKSSINDLFFFAGADLLTPALEKISTALGDVFDSLRGIVDSGLAAGWGQALGDAAASAIGWIKDLITDVQNVKAVFDAGGWEALWGKFIPIWVRRRLERIGIILTPMFRDVRRGLGAIAGWFRQLWDRASEMFAALPPGEQIVRGILNAMIAGAQTAARWWDELKVIAASLMEKIAGLVQVVRGEGLRGLWGLVVPQDVTIRLKAIAYLLQPVAQDIAAMVNSIREAVVGLFQKLAAETVNAKAQLPEFWDVIRAGLDLLVSGAAWLRNNWITIKAVFLTVWEVIKAVVEAVATVFRDSVVPALQGAFSEIGKALGDLGITWSDVFAALKTTVVATAAVVAALLIALVAVLTGVITGIAQALKHGVQAFNAFRTDVVAMSDALKSAWAALVEFWNDLIAGEWTQAVADLEALFAGLSEFLVKLLASIYDLFDMTVGQIVALIAGFVEGVYGFFKSLYDSLVGHSLIPDLVNAIIATFTNVDWGGIGRSIVDGIKGGISGAVGGLVSAAQSAARAALDAAKGILGIHSPSRAFEQVGQAVMEGFARGIGLYADLPTGAMRGAAGSLQSAAVRQQSQTIVIYGGLTLQGVQDAGGLIEQLQALSVV